MGNLAPSIRLSHRNAGPSEIQEMVSTDFFFALHINKYIWVDT